jgi:acyl-CoA synthetase (AMP-forming)/AMP-acid ligase II
MWLPHVLRRNVLRNPDGLALRDRRRDVTWREFARDVAALAAVLAKRVPVGGRVLMLSGNRVEMLEAYFACAAAGVVATPVNPGLVDPEIAYIETTTQPSLAIVDEAGRERLRVNRPDLPILSIEDIAGLPASAPLDRASALTEPVAILHTSATTGRPKGVVVDQRSFQLNALSWIADVGVPPGTAFLNPCPLFHGSMVIALDYLAAGATVCVLDKFTPNGCLAALEQWRIEHAFLVPSMVRLLLESRALESTDLSALTLISHGAAPMPAELEAAAKARLGVALQTIFGITEGGGPVLSLKPDDKPGSPPVPGAVCVGLPMLGTEVRVLDEHGAPAEVDEVGELHLRGDGLMQGYWRDPDATDAALRQGWLNTKDLGCIGQDGYLWVVDRRNDLILRGGQNVYPAEIEHVLRMCPQVADVAVVPATSMTWGQTPVAFIQQEPGAALAEDTLIELCVTQLASYKRPSAFVFVEQIPRNPAGKILRAGLRKRAEEHAS